MNKTFATIACLASLAGCTSNDNNAGQTRQNDQNNPSMSSGASANVSDQDKTFVRDAAMGGMAEVQQGQIAAQQASNDQVRSFGRDMVTDHTKANDQLKQLASQKGITVPTELDSKHQMMIDSLSKLSGAQFDQMYAPGQVAAHQETIQLFQDEAKNGQDPDLKAFASSTLPTLQHHLDMIKGIAGTGMKSGLNHGSQGTMDDTKPGVTGSDMNHDQPSK